MPFDKLRSVITISMADFRNSSQSLDGIGDETHGTLQHRLKQTAYRDASSSITRMFRHLTRVPTTSDE